MRVNQVQANDEAYKFTVEQKQTQEASDVARKDKS